MTTIMCLLPTLVVGKLVMRSIAMTSKGRAPFSMGLYSFDIEYFGLLALHIGHSSIVFTTSLKRFPQE